MVVKGDGWNRMFNYQRDVLVKLPIWTTADDRRRALSYVDRDLDVQMAIDTVQTGKEPPSTLGVIVAAARYEDAGWMPDGCFDRWRRWVFQGVEKKTVPELVEWLEDVERAMRAPATPEKAPPARVSYIGPTYYGHPYLDGRGYFPDGHPLDKPRAVPAGDEASTTRTSNPYARGPRK